MLHRVVKPFPYSENGFTLVDLNAGDERDFGSMADGLVAEGYVEPVAAVSTLFEESPAAVVEPVVEMLPAEEEVSDSQPVTRRKRK